MKEPERMSDIDKYSLSPEDFSSAFHRNIFAAIHNLYQNGITKVTPLDIETYLNGNPSALAIFKSQGGIDYLLDCENLTQTENFDYYYTKLKKINCLRDLKNMGYDISNLYSEEPTEKAKKINERFENLSITEIFDSVKKDITILESKYERRSDTLIAKASDGIFELLEQLKESPAVGVKLQGDILNTIIRGGRKGTFHLRSAATGIGKSRSMVADACYVSYPIRYDTFKKEWVATAQNEISLYIPTEQTLKEIQTIILAYLSGINEDQIVTQRLSPEEYERVITAAQIMADFSDNLHIVRMPEPNIAQIKTLVRKYYFEYDIDNLFFDYIFLTPSLLSEFRDLRIRDDVALNLLSTALKDLAADLQIFVSSATQLNREKEDGRSGMKNQYNLRGALSIADKIDVGYIMQTPSEDEITMLKDFIDSIGVIPNLVSDIYKLRQGQFNAVRIWSFFDLGTGRKKDLFVTRADFSPVHNFQVIDYIPEQAMNFTQELQKYNKTANKKKEKIEERSNTSWLLN